MSSAIPAAELLTCRPYRIAEIPTQRYTINRSLPIRARWDFLKVQMHSKWLDSVHCPFIYFKWRALGLTNFMLTFICSRWCAYAKLDPCHDWTYVVGRCLFFCSRSKCLQHKQEASIALWKKIDLVITSAISKPESHCRAWQLREVLASCLNVEELQKVSKGECECLLERTQRNLWLNLKEETCHLKSIDCQLEINSVLKLNVFHTSGFIVASPLGNLQQFIRDLVILRIPKSPDTFKAFWYFAPFSSIFPLFFSSYSFFLHLFKSIIAIKLTLFFYLFRSFNCGHVIVRIHLMEDWMGNQSHVSFKAADMATIKPLNLLDAILFLSCTDAH